MPKTIVRENDTLDEALKRFKRDVSDRHFMEARKRQHYMKPAMSVKKKKSSCKQGFKRH